MTDETNQVTQVPNELPVTEVQLDALKLRLAGWLLKRLGAFFLALVTVAGGALVIIFDGIAKETAEQGVTKGVVKKLPEDEDFRSILKRHSALPKGAVVAVNGPECPAGEDWRPFLQGAGRVVVGAGTGSGLTQRDWTAGGTTGGSEIVTLGIPHIPAHAHPVEDQGHSHEIPWDQQAAVGRGVQERSAGDESRVQASPRSSSATTGIAVGEVGDGQPHENMPPFVVLTLCEKME